MKMSFSHGAEYPSIDGKEIRIKNIPDCYAFIKKYYRVLGFVKGRK